jgi:DNA invertase Pin-like site-specific DNA recombinase
MSKAERLLRKGKTLGDVQRAFPKINARSLRIVKARVGIPNSYRAKAKAKLMKSFVAAGYSVRQIAKMYGISRQLVYLLLRKHGEASQVNSD